MRLKMLVPQVPLSAPPSANIPMRPLEQVNVILDLLNLGLGVIEIRMHAVQLCAVHLALHVDASLGLYQLQSIVQVLD